MVQCKQKLEPEILLLEERYAGGERKEREKEVNGGGVDPSTALFSSMPALHAWLILQLLSTLVPYARLAHIDTSVAVPLGTNGQGANTLTHGKVKS